MFCLPSSKHLSCWHLAPKFYIYIYIKTSSFSEEFCHHKWSLFSCFFKLHSTYERPYGQLHILTKCRTKPTAFLVSCSLVILIYLTWVIILRWKYNSTGLDCGPTTTGTHPLSFALLILPKYKPHQYILASLELPIYVLNDQMSLTCHIRTYIMGLITTLRLTAMTTRVITPVQKSKTIDTNLQISKNALFPISKY